MLSKGGRMQYILVALDVNWIQVRYSQEPCIDLKWDVLFNRYGLPARTVQRNASGCKQNTAHCFASWAARMSDTSIVV